MLEVTVNGTQQTKSNFYLYFIEMYYNIIYYLEQDNLCIFYLYINLYKL